jgi:glycosyltransferase involved in cell wall biosynthesis
VGEAMSCGVPCVVTDVGDSGYLVGDTGVIVPPRDPQALAQGLLRLVSLLPEKRRALGEKARRRIQSFFSIQAVTITYQQLYENVISHET